MTFRETRVHGAWVIEPELRGDARGFFTRVWDRETFARHGLSVDFPQCNNSACRHRGTLRRPDRPTARSPQADAAGTILRPAHTMRGEVHQPRVRGCDAAWKVAPAPRLDPTFPMVR